MAIDYNKSVLPLYSDLDGDADFTQELATQSSRAFDSADSIVGATAEQITINAAVDITVTGTGFGGDATLSDWLTAIQAAAGFTGLTPDMEAAIITQQDGGKVLVIVAVDDGTPVDITTVAGTLDGLPSLGMPAATVLSGGDLGLGRADQKNEQRILTTLGVLVAHMRLLSTRTEARNLHFVLSRIATGVGSGGFVYADETSEVVGNVKNPAFKSTDTVSIEAINEAEAPADEVKIDTGLVDISAGPLYDLDEVVAAINAAVVTAGGDAEGLEAINAGGHLKLVSAKGWTIFVKTQGTAHEIATKAGIEIGQRTQSKRSEVATKVEQEALDYFDTNRRALNL